LEALDKEQARLMEERVILVDRDDNVTGHESKVNSHHMSGGLLLHRAFSVFLFDAQKRMLLQKRASVKATFASFWTNACCSHPLYVDDELSPGGDTVRGAQNAAVRKLSHELGVRGGSVDPKELFYLTRIHYRAPSGGEWGEHEIDYVFFLQKDVELNPSSNEIDEVKYVTPSELQDMFDREAKDEVKITPWFKYIMQSVGFSWWEKLGTPALREAVDRDNILRFGDV